MTEVERWSPFKVWLFSLTSRSPQSNIAAVDLLELGPGDRFLDIGCGLGAALEYGQKAGAETAGIDPSPTMVERARKRVPTAEVELGSAEEIPFPDDRFTAVMAVATFHHWADRDRGLAEVLRILAPGGRLLVMEQHLKRGTGHGLSPEGARGVVATLRDLGFQAPEISHLKEGRHRFVTVSALKPAGPTDLSRFPDEAAG